MKIILILMIILNGCKINKPTQPKNLAGMVKQSLNSDDKVFETVCVVREVK